MDHIRENLERISELSAEELKALEDSIIKEFEVLDSQDRTVDSVKDMSELATNIQTVRAEFDAREKRAAELSNEAEAAASIIKGNPEAASNEEAVVEEEGSENELSTEETTTEAPVESELSTEEAPAEEPAKEAELSVEETTTEDSPAEAEASNEVSEEAELSSNEPAEVEEPAKEAELATEETETTDTPEAELAAEELESSEEPVTASNTPNEELFEAPADRRPAIPKSNSSNVTITAGADLKGIVAGAELPDLSAVAQAVIDRKKSMGRTSGGDNEQALVASFKIDIPEEQFLNSNDFEGNRTKIDDAVAIVAAGGLMAPVETTYEIFGLGETDDRPVRDSLPSFGADRGGIRFLTPPTLADLNGAVSVWTLQDDIDAAEDGATIEKPCIRVAAGNEVTVYTEAIPLCLTFGNLGARAYPELVERHIKLAMVQHARFAETRLLTRIGALSTSVSAAAQLGAARDIFVQIEAAASAYRSRYRISPTAQLRTIFPTWFKNALRADLVKEIPGNGREAAFSLADAQINRFFAERNINVTWHIDGETGQIFGSQAPGALLGFPQNVIWYMFSEGTFLFLDGGTLDLGLVRDSTLNATNDYKLFLETFEGVAKVGVESLRVTSQLRIWGASAATVNTTA